MYLKSRRNGAGSRDEVVGDKASNAQHGKTSVLKLLQAHFLLLGVVQLVPLVGPVDDGGSLASVGLAFEFSAVFDSLDGTTENDELCPPLGIGLKDGVNGVGGGDIIAVKSSNKLRPGPSNGGQHSRAAIGELSLSEVLSRSPLRQTNGIELWVMK